MKRFFLSLLFGLLLLTSVFGQDLGDYATVGRGGVAATFATDYQAVSINPANLGMRLSFRDPTYTFGLFELNSTIFAEALSRKDLLNAIFRSSNPVHNFRSFSEKAAAAEKIANTNFSLNADAVLLGAGIRLKGGHGLGFAIRDRVQFFTTINKNAAEIAFLGYNASYFPELILSNGTVISNPRYPGNDLPALSEAQQEQVVLGGYLNSPDSAKLYSNILDGSRISSSWYREYNLSYGKQLIDSYNFSLYAGVGAKFLSGFLLIDVIAKEGKLERALISTSPSFGLDFGEGDPDTPKSPTFSSPEQVSTFRKVFFPKKVGSGYGFDVGFTGIIRRNFRFAVALTNLGKMVWNGNVYKVNDGKLVNFAGAGLDNYNVLGASQGALQFAGDKSPLSWKGTNKITESLPGTLRFGISYEFFRTFHLGTDLIVPLNQVAGNLHKPLLALGGDFRPSKIFRISTGLNAGGNNGGAINLPLGLTYLARRGFYEAGIATQDIKTLLAGFGRGSTISIALGFFRLKI